MNSSVYTCSCGKEFGAPFTLRAHQKGCTETAPVVKTTRTVKKAVADVIKKVTKPKKSK